MDDLQDKQEKLLAQLEKISWQVADKAFHEGDDESVYLQMEAQAITETLGSVRRRRKHKQR